jgi:hypothetical protein
MKSTVRKYCILRDNETLRLAVTQTLKRHDLTAICREMGMNRISVYEWLNGRNARRLRQYDIIKLCKKIGIVIDLKITYSNNELD